MYFMCKVYICIAFLVQSLRWRARRLAASGFARRRKRAAAAAGIKANFYMAQGSFIVPADVLRDLAARIFEAHDVPESDAQRVADCLVQADLRGVSSHGVGRIPIYTERLRKGLVKARPQIDRKSTRLNSSH